MTYISGQILSQDGKPMRWVGVLLDIRTSRQAISLTNKEGRFAFQTTPGEHSLAIRTFAFAPYTQNYDIPRRGLEGIVITLKPALRMLDYPLGVGSSG